MRRRMPLVGRRFEFEDGDLTSSTPPCNARSESADDFRRGFHGSGIPDRPASAFETTLPVVFPETLQLEAPQVYYVQ